MELGCFAVACGAIHNILSWREFITSRLGKSNSVSHRWTFDFEGLLRLIGALPYAKDSKHGNKVSMVVEEIL